eukprot:TRINITY_DN6125_c0_g1_i5.p1 TRINITY_DN6125_c0_g1~~TRINITY_DN6125_c0_g1_i5.p1  ORF type:complete len:616 (-),score=101.01 TRINITY_DN6125_c0_g1_i5:10-1857(-)
MEEGILEAHLTAVEKRSYPPLKVDYKSSCCESNACCGTVQSLKTKGCFCYPLSINGSEYGAERKAFVNSLAKLKEIAPWNLPIGERKKFSRTFQKKIMSDFEQKLQEPPTMSNLSLYFLCKMAQVAFTFELEAPLQRIVDIFELQFPRAARFIVSDDFLDSPLAAGAPTILELYREWYEGLKQLMIDAAFSNGFMMRLQDGRHEHAPLTMIPQRIRQEDVESLRKVQQIWHRLLTEMVHSPQYIKDKLAELRKADDFVNNLLLLLEEAERSPHRQRSNLCIIRNDYLFDGCLLLWKQVEINLFAPSFGCLADKTHTIHKYLLNPSHKSVEGGQLGPIDATRDMFIDSFTKVHQMYGSQDAVVVFVVDEKEWNVFDQRCVELDLLKSSGIHSVRKTLAEIAENAVFNENDGSITIDGLEVALFYYRTGYTPKHYPTQVQWKARTLIESSRAFKLPCVEFQLLNLKYFQLVLSKEKELRRFVEEEDDIRRLQETFALFWSFESEEETKEIYEIVKKNPRGFVLKPQREGGGNNVYDKAALKQIEDAIQNGTTESLKEYILMKRIESNPRLSVGLARGEVSVFKSISEISLFSAFTCCLLYTSPSPRDRQKSRMPSSA